MIPTRPTCRAGFATALAIALIALVAVALTAMAAVLRVEARQSISANTDVQIRQMLLAAEPFARAALNDPNAREVNVPLPDALTQNNGGLTVDAHADGAKSDVTITAVYGEFSRSAVQHFQKQHDRWTLKGATLLPLQRQLTSRER